MTNPTAPTALEAATADHRAAVELRDAVRAAKAAVAGALGRVNRPESNLDARVVADLFNLMDEASAKATVMAAHAFDAFDAEISA